MNDTLSQGLTTIRLYGVLGKRFGRMHGRLLESGTVREAMSALKHHTMEGFETFMREAESKGLTFAVFRGRTNLSGEQLDMRGREDIRIVPLVIGSKQSGLFQTVLGAALIAVGVFATSLTLGTSTFLISAGASMMLGGVMQMLSPQPKGLKGREAPENAPSYAFGGPVNTIAQGHPVGVLYGKRRIGGAVISAGIYAEDRL
ncbi:TPA: tail assembly protein [Pseudomonas aeruginosa]|nr:tail assembly protein [Pseudomonas aeruginosa]HCW0367770.1 tail assembly protein [Pseudomonas aeruginosa]HCW0926411.1 tail assembly protein [Pseudomonas aeruginosa]